VYYRRRYASLTEYVPKHYNLANTIDATSVNAKATAGINATDKAANKTPNAPNRRCKLAEPVKVGFVIDSTLLTMPQSHKGSGKGRLRLCYQILV
jgi:hypothetical protein